MTLGGLALAIGILVDEATVEIENIHAQRNVVIRWLERFGLVTRKQRFPDYSPCFASWLFFIPAFLMQGAVQRLFSPLALAVWFSTLGSYILSSTFVPVMSMWLMCNHDKQQESRSTFFDRIRSTYESLLRGLVKARWLVIACYLLVSCGAIAFIVPKLGVDIFPLVDGGQFRMNKFAAPTVRILSEPRLMRRRC